MSRIPLPVIVGFGGVNAAGRSSFHHGYKRTVIDKISQNLARDTWQSLAVLTGTNASDTQWLSQNTLVRKIDTACFDVNAVPWNRRITLSSDSQSSFLVRKQHLPETIPPNWQVDVVDEKTVKVMMTGDTAFLLPDTRVFDVKAAGQLPTGFAPGTLYQSRNHPRGIQMTVYGASDALGSMGISWETVQQKVKPDEVSVYAGSGMSQLDGQSNGGMMSARLQGKKVTSKVCPFGFAEMPADFINAYILGNLGNTGTSMGACASFLYNLYQGISDIKQGRARVVMVGNSEAPIVPEVMDGYAAMGALATDKELLALEGKTEGSPDYRRACRPFADNCGFTIAESAQFIILMDDALALEMGAQVFGSVADVFVNADGHKKSISAPGIGNYITVAKALACAESLLGNEKVKNSTFVQAHGTGTPQNRVTESHLLNEVAKTFGISNWPVAAVKSYLGHSIGVAAGDQLISSLGVWQYGLLPGINTIDEVADDVHASHLSLNKEHSEIEKSDMGAAIINAKGFGGNNATATVLSPQQTEVMLTKRYGTQAITRWKTKQEKVVEHATQYEQLALKGETSPIYKFDHEVLTGDEVTLNREAINLPGYEPINLQINSDYDDMGE